MPTPLVKKTSLHLPRRLEKRLRERGGKVYRIIVLVDWSLVSWINPTDRKTADALCHSTQSRQDSEKFVSGVTGSVKYRM